MHNPIMKMLQSPLLQFLIIGAVIYAGFAATHTDTSSDASNTIRITVGDVGWLEDSFAKRWNRSPSPEERQGLIDSMVRETVLYREAVAMGLDQDDVIIRRRLAQKLEFLFQDLADSIPPTEQDLQDHFAAQLDDYRTPEVMTFTQVFVDPDRRGDKTLDDAADMLVQLEAMADPAQAAAEVGDPLMLQAYYPERPQSEVAKLFGIEFARALFDLDPGRWHGPVLSGYGTHLVYVHGRTQFPPPEFEQVRDRVAEDWQAQKRESFNEETLARLLERYEIVVEEEEDRELVAAAR
jgi:peptidyl-prolyl cis-trans isomerase C